VDSGATFSFPFGVALDQSATIAYVTNASSAIVSGCDITGDVLSSCVSTDFSPLDGLRGIAINSVGDRAFIISNSNYLLSCPVTGKNIELDCGSTQDALDSPVGVALNEDETIAYVVNYSNETVAKCTIAEDGTIVGCADSGATNLHGSNSIAIWSSPF
jgi:DNA-binding beta-propeller fold protein YncE